MSEFSSEPSVAVIILNLNNYEDTAECLRSLQDSEYDNISVVVVDNGSDDQSPTQLSDQFDIELIQRETNGGFGGGNNTGIKWVLERKFDYVFLLNNDTVVGSKTIGHLVAALEQKEEYGIAAPKLYYYDEDDVLQAFGAEIVSWKANTIPYGQGERDFGQYDEQRCVAQANGAAMMIDIEVIREVGLFDEDYGFYTDDLDYCYRARDSGFSIVAVPDTSVQHKVSATAGTASPFTAYYTIRGRLLFARNHGSISDWVRFVPYILYFTLYRIAAHLRYGNPITALAVVRGLVHGALGKTGLRTRHL